METTIGEAELEALVCASYVVSEVKNVVSEVPVVKVVLVLESESVEALVVSESVIVVRVFVIWLESVIVVREFVSTMGEFLVINGSFGTITTGGRTKLSNAD